MSASQVFITSALAALLFAMFAMRRSAMMAAIAKQDWLGLLYMGLGAFLGVVGSRYKIDMLTTLGGLMFGFGVLVVLPQGLTEKLVQKRNTGLVFVLFAIGIAILKVVVPMWPWVVEAFNVLYKHGEWRQILWLVATFVLTVVGIVIFFGGAILARIKKGKESK